MPRLHLEHDNGKREEYQIKDANRDGSIVVVQRQNGELWYIPIEKYKVVKICDGL